MKLLVAFVALACLLASASALGIERIRERVRVGWHNGGVTLCKDLKAGKPANTGAADTICDNSQSFLNKNADKAYNKQKCKEVVSPLYFSFYNHLRGKTHANIDCEAMDPDFEFVKHAWSNNGKAAAQSAADMYGLRANVRIGLEDETDLFVTAVRTTVAHNHATRNGIVSYSQELFTSAAHADSMGLTTVALTIDSDKVDPDWDRDSKNAVAALFGVDPADIVKDGGFGNRGIIEMVTGPVINTEVRKSMKAFRDFTAAALNMAGNCANAGIVPPGELLRVNDQFPDDVWRFAGNRRGYAIKLSAVVAAYDLVAAADPDLANYRLTVPKPSGAPNYELVVLCSGNPRPLGSEALQVNFGVPLAKVGTAEFADLLTNHDDGVNVYLADEYAKDAWTRCRTAAQDFLDTNLRGLRTNTDVVGFFTVYYMIAFARLMTPHVPNTATQQKNFYGLLPKVNMPDIVRFFPDSVKEKLLEWYNGGNLASRATQLRTAGAAAFAGKQLPNGGGIVGIAASFGNQFTNSLRVVLEPNFHAQCVARFPGEVAGTYGTGYAAGINWGAGIGFNAPNCDYASIDKIVKVFRLPGGKISIVVEARADSSRLNQNFLPSTATWTGAGNSLDNGVFAPTAEMQKLFDLQNQ